MKVDRPTIWNMNEPLEIVEQSTTPGIKVVEDKSSQPAELQQKPVPKTDSVETKESTSVILDNIASAPKIDPSEVNLGKGNEVPAALIPGIPFREKAELPKTLPNGNAVDSGVGSGDLGFGKTRPGPNHMGIDLKGQDIRNQLDDALKLKGGSAGETPSAPSGGTVNLTGLPGKPGTSSGDSAIAPGKTGNTYDAGFSHPGMGLISADKDGKSVGGKIVDKVVEYVTHVAVHYFGKIPGTSEALTIVEMPAKTEEITGDAKDHLRGVDALVNPEKRLDKILDSSNDKYVNPDSDGTQPVTEDSLEKIAVRLGSKTQPGVEEHLQEVDASMVSATDPRRPLISNPNPEEQSTGTPAGNPGVILDVKGPDKDPELAGGGEPIVFDPNRPKP